MRSILITFLLLLSYELSAQNLSISGFVLDNESKQAIPDVEVILMPNKIQTKTDSNGFFKFELLEKKEFHIEFKRLDYVTENIKFKLSDSAIENVIIRLNAIARNLKTVVVNAQTSKESEISEMIAHSHILEGKDLQRELSLSLAATMKNEIGISIRSMGPAPARPVVRGLGGDRVKINEDGNKVADLSASSADHALAIEPFNIERVEILRGPKVLLHTPTTIGAVINVVKNEIPNRLHNELHGEAGAIYESSNQAKIGMLGLEIPFKDLQSKAYISSKKSENINAPNQELKNTKVSSLNAAFGVNYFAEDYELGASFSNLEMQYGIPGGFVGSHPNGVNIEMQKNALNAKWVYHLHKEFVDDITFDSSRSYYNHIEKESNGLVGAEFLFREYHSKLDFTQHKFGLLSNGNFGIGLDYRNLGIGGFVFTPPTQSYNFYSYIFEEMQFDDIAIQAALRSDYLKILPEKIGKITKAGLIDEKSFLTLSASVSFVYNFASKYYLGANISRSNRPPSPEELFSEGPHLAAYSYDIGNSELKTENGFGYELFLNYKEDEFQASITAFLNDMPYYIIPRNTGDTNYAQLLPIYQTRGEAVRMYGLEASLSYDLLKDLKFNVNMAYTEGKFYDNTYMPLIPPLKIHTGLEYTLEYLRIGLNAEIASSQDKVDAFEEKTNSYLIFGAYAQFIDSFNEYLAYNVSLSVENLLNETYYNHLSRIKSIMPEAGRNIRLNLKAFL